MNHPQALSLLAALGMLFTLPLQAQKGDARDEPGTVQEETWRQFDVPEAPILSPLEALKQFRVPPGFRLEVAAAEPLVNDPVAIAWDADGRLFAVEMWSYMPNADGEGEALPNGRVVVMEDLDQDGRMDRSTVFLDQLHMPRALSIVEGGVLIAEPPHLWFCPDRDNNLRCDEKIRVGDYATEGTVEHMENGLWRGLDNWLYNARSDRRMFWQNGELQVEQTAWRGQWGMSMDDDGRLFTANNSQPLLADVYPWRYANRNPYYETRRGTEQTLMKNTAVFSTRVNPGVNRGYRDTTLRTDGRLHKATAASGPTVYRGHRYEGAFDGDAFFTEPAANLVGQVRLHESGLALRGEHVLYDDPDWQKRDAITSSDERFRPVNLASGPDGYLYIVDMYRGILQHREFLTTFLRKQIIERELDAPVGLGRIYRLVPESGKADYAVPRLSMADELTLIDTLRSANGWQRDTAQRLLVERSELTPASRQALKTLTLTQHAPSALHALWVLHAHEALDPEFLGRVLEHPDARVRVHAIRTAEAQLNTPSVQVPFLSLEHDRDERVRLQFYQSLGQIDEDARVLTVAQRWLDTRDDDRPFVDALVSSLSGRESDFLTSALNVKHWLYDEGRSALLAALAATLYRGKATEALLELMNTAASQATYWQAQALFDGVKAASSDPEIARPSLPHAPDAASIALFEKAQINWFSDAFSWPGNDHRDSKAALSSTELASIERGDKLYRQYCSACHQNTGEGLEGLAPPLNQSEWVNGSALRLALVVTQGVQGPIEVRGVAWDGVMPAHGGIDALQGQGLADLLSFLRMSWGNRSGVLSQQALDTMLAPYSEHEGSWRAESLDALTDL